MITFYELPWYVRLLTSFILVSTEVADIWNVIYAIRTRKKHYIYVASGLFVIAYTLQEITLMVEKARFTGVVDNTGFLPLFISAPLMLGEVALVTAISGLVVYLNFWYRKTNITPNAIKDFADQIQAGMCYYQEGGKVVFQNREMNRLCIELLGKSLLNGEELCSAVEEKTITFSDGTVRRFDHRIVDLNSRPVHELIAFDVTELTEKTRILNRENEELKRLNANLREYNIKIDDTVRREEILQAKVNIHDEMNRLMLMTIAAADDDNIPKSTNIMGQWKELTNLLGREKESAPDRIGPIMKLAELLGIQVEITGENVETLAKDYADLFSMAAREALANASKYADADRLYINISVDSQYVSFVFKNDGIIPDTEVIPRGGLANLATIASDLKGHLETDISDGFTLTIKLANWQR